MEIYKVRSGQNIYDVALQCHGSVEGVFDLLMSNTTAIGGGLLSLETELKPGMELAWHREFTVNSGIVSWLADNGVRMSNGDTPGNPAQPLSIILRHTYAYHAKRYNEIVCGMTVGDQLAAWRAMSRPRMLIRQSGEYSGLGVWPHDGTHAMVDWGDATPLVLVDDGKESLLEHQYTDGGIHIVTLYGDFICRRLDLSGVCGVHYCLDSIIADEFIDTIGDTYLNTLIREAR